MLYCRFIAVAVAGVMFSGQLALAQASGPAEVPPSSFAENQYVDSRGCAFIRAGVSGNVVWVPRIGNDRRPICGLRPTGAAGTAVAAATPPEPAAPPTPAQPRTATGPNAPINTVATTTTPPRVTATPAAPAAPRTTAAAPAAAAPAAPAAPPEPRRVTLAEICEGRSGIQAGIIDSRTGQPVNCGGAQVAAVSAPAQAPAQAPASAMAPAATGQPDAVMRRMTLAELCAESQGTGASYINRATGQPIDCGPAAPVAVAQAPVRAPVQAPVLAPVQAPAPAAAPVPVSAPQQRSAPMQESFPPLALSQMSERVRHPTTAPMPETFPPLSMAQVNAPAPGYRPAFEDGRLNPERGIVPAAARPAIVGGHFVQVGTFGVSSNADRAAARLESLGYSVAFQSVQRNGQSLRVVAAGPFATQAEAQAALRAARNAGYGDAFIR